MILIKKFKRLVIFKQLIFKQMDFALDAAIELIKEVHRGTENIEHKHKLDYSLMILVDISVRCPQATNEQHTVINKFQKWVYDHWDNLGEDFKPIEWEDIFRSELLHDLFDCLYISDPGEELQFNKFNDIIESRLGLQRLALPLTWPIKIYRNKNKKEIIPKRHI
jgi:hypothetical protein